METLTLRPVRSSTSLQIDCLFHSGTKGALLYIEGLGCSRYDFAGAFDYPELKGYTLASFDFPGTGSSPYPQGLRLDIDDLVEITEMVAAELGLESFVIAGHSMGGLIALLYTEKYPQRVRGFINIEGNLASEDCFFSRRIASRTSAGQAGRVMQSLAKRLALSPEKGMSIYAGALAQASPQACLDYSKLTVDYSDNGDLLHRYMALKIPTLFVYGEHNSSRSYLPILKENGCRSAEIAGGGHFLFHDNPGAYYRAVADFVSTLY